MEVGVLARAKVNLFLSVVGRRPDGYHEVETVMQSVDLFDEVDVGRAEVTTVSIKWAPGLSGPVPAAPDLVEKALGVFAEATGREAEAEVRVVKQIPIGAGLGGGSADAAAALLGINELLDRPASLPELEEMCARVGSDVPFALRGGVALATGRGEMLSPLSCPACLWWVLAMPEAGLSTASVYRRRDELPPAPRGRDSQELTDALGAGDLRGVGASLHNDLEEAAFSLDPSLASRKRALLDAGALGAVMTGSGSAVAALCRDESHAREVARRVAPEFARVEVAPGAARGAETVDPRDVAM